MRSSLKQKEAQKREVEMHQQKPTLQDVATATGVSTATVSRCINRHFASETSTA